MVMKNINLGILGIITAATSINATAQTTTQKQPNIIFILADDMGYGDLSCYGNAIIETPNIDTLASEGKKFTHFYAGSAVSTPSRVSLMTGKFPIRYNVRAVFRDKNEYLPQEDINLAKVLKEAGYHTAHIGKWHLGGARSFDIDRRNDNTPTSPGPLQQGFDHALTSIEGKPIRAELMTTDRLYKEAGEHLIRNDQYAAKEYDHWEDIKTSETLRLMEQYSKSDKPFFINLWLDAPHAPYEASPNFTAQFEKMGASGKRLNFYSMVAHIDHNVGVIKQKLKELGIYDNTIIVFTSDNGPAHHGSSGPFKGAKTDLHEGGIRVPCIISWNGVIPNGVSHNVYHFADFLPTLSEIANGKELDYNGDGQSIYNDLTSCSNEYKPREKRLFFQLDKSGNSQLQGPRPLPHASIVAIDGNWKILADTVGGELKPLELFNIMNDQHELKNLLGQYPDIENSLLEYINQTLSAPRNDFDPELGYDANDFAK